VTDRAEALVSCRAPDQVRRDRAEVPERGVGTVHVVTRVQKICLFEVAVIVILGS
jgi:hypothetical protein